VRKNHLTVIFMKDTNRPITYVISIRLLIILVILLVGGASTYAFFIKGYFSLFQDNQQLEEIIRSLRTEIGTLQGSINTIRKQQTTTVKSEETENPAAASNEPLVEKNDMVAIQELVFERKASKESLEFSFVLDNATADERMLRGYLFVVLRDNQGKKISSFPEVGIKEGLPVDYHQGDRYAIRRFKGYRGELKLGDTAGQFEILVYSDTGEILVRVKKPVPAAS
jgi:hypothetical protein